MGFISFIKMIKNLVHQHLEAMIQQKKILTKPLTFTLPTVSNGSNSRLLVAAAAAAAGGGAGREGAAATFFYKPLLPQKIHQSMFV